MNDVVAANLVSLQVRQEGVSRLRVDLVEKLKLLGLTDRECRTALIVLIVDNEGNEAVIRAVEAALTDVAIATGKDIEI